MSQPARARARPLLTSSIQSKTPRDKTADLLAKSSANKELNDKKRLATSSANLARTRTVADGTCGCVGFSGL